MPSSGAPIVSAALGAGASDGARGFHALALQIDVESPNDISSSVQLLADFALKLSLGPVSRLWVPDVRRSVDALLLTGKHRNETALVALSSRLLGMLPDGSRDAETTACVGAASSSDASAAADAPSNANTASGSEPSLTPDANAAAGPTVSSDTSAALNTDVASEASAISDSSVVEPIAGALREHILHEVSRLAGVLPEWPASARDLAEEARRRETRVMRELFAQVDGLKRDQRARLEEQMRLEELASMSPEAIAEEFDVPVERSSELQRVLDAYREERQARAPDLSNAIGLSLALDELDEQCRAFDDCDPEQKDMVRVLRASRRRALSALNLLLAERGELEWLEQLEPLAIRERVERLKHWLDVGERAS